METIGFIMDVSKFKEFFLEQCKIARSLGAVNIKYTANEFIFIDKNDNEVLKINRFDIDNNKI